MGWPKSVAESRTGLDDQKAQLQVLFQQLEGQFYVPALGVDSGHGCHGEGARVMDGDVAMQGVPLAESHQAHGVAGSVGSVRPQATPSKVSIVGMNHLVLVLRRSRLSQK